MMIEKRFFLFFVVFVLLGWVSLLASPDRKKTNECMSFNGYEERIDCLFRTLQETPEDVYALFALAHERTRNGDESRFLAELSRLIEMRPRLAHLYLMRAEIKESTGDLEGANEDREIGNLLESIPDVRKAEAQRFISPTEENALEFLKRARTRYFIGDYEGTIEDCTTFLHLEPDVCSSAAFTYLYSSNERIGKTEEAIDVLTLQLEKCPGSAKDVYLRRARLKHKIGDVEGARLDEEESARQE